MRQSRALLKDGRMDPSTRRLLHGRLRVWPRLVAFLLTYLVSSVPIALYDSLNLSQARGCNSEVTVRARQGNGEVTVRWNGAVTVI